MCNCFGAYEEANESGECDRTCNLVELCKRIRTVYRSNPKKATLKYDGVTTYMIVEYVWRANGKPVNISIFEW